MHRTRFGAVTLWVALAAAGLVVLSGYPSPAVAGLVTTNLTLNFDASLDTDGDSKWEDLNGHTTNDWTLGTNVTRDTSPTTSIPGITAAYNFPTSGTDVAANKATASSCQSLPADPTDASASFELWFKPDALADDQVLWESGGAGHGWSFTIRNTDLRLTVLTGGPHMVVETPLTGLTGDFIHAVGTYDRDNPSPTDTLRLYVNGTEVVTSPDTDTGVNDWDGGGGAGLGGRKDDTGGHNAGGVGLNFGTLDGQIAIVRLYEKTLTGTEVQDNYNAVTAADVFFDDGGTGSDWGTDANWDTDIEPTSGQNAFVNGGLAAEVTLSGEVAKTLTVGSSSTGGPNTPGAGTLTVTSGKLTVSDDITIGDGNTGTVNVSGGTLSVGGSINDGAGTSTINFDGGTLATGSTDITVDDFNINPDSTPDTPNLTYTRSGGTLTVNNNLKLGGEGKSTTSNYRGNLTQTGGDVVVGKDLIFGGAASREGGTYNLNAGTLTVSGDIIETTSGVDAAQMHLNGGTLSMPNGASGSTIKVQRFSVAETTGANVTYTANAPITTTGTLAVGGLSNAIGVMIIDDSTFPVNAGNCRLGQGNTANGTLRVENDGIFNVTGGPLQIAGDATTGSDKDTKGALIVGTAGGGGNPQVSVKGHTEVGVGGTGSFTMHSGTFTQLTGNLLIGKAADAFGTLLIDGGSLAVTNTLINGNATTGTGLFHIIGDAATINVGGYSQNSKSTLEVDINGISPINVAGRVDLDGYLDVEFINPPAAGLEFPIIILNDPSEEVTGNFISKPEGALFMADGFPFLVGITYEGGTGNDVVLTTTPEPATLTLLALGGLGLLARRRRRR